MHSVGGWLPRAILPFESVVGPILRWDSTRRVGGICWMERKYFKIKSWLWASVFLIELSNFESNAFIYSNSD